MPFTLDDIETIKVGADPVELVRRLKRIGVLACGYDLHTGVFTYQGDNNHILTAPTNGLHIGSAIEPNPDAVKDAVEKLLHGAVNFEGFCYEIAAAGVFSWEANLELLHVEYKNKTGKVLMRELIPAFYDQD